MKKIALIFGVLSAMVGSVAAGHPLIALLIGAFVPAPKGALMVTFTMGLCEKIQTSLIEIMRSKAPQVNRTKVGYLEALLSPQNKQGVTMIPIDIGNGKKRTVRIKYLQRGTEADIVTSETVCLADTGLEKEPSEVDVDITNYIGTVPLQFTEDEMRKLCEADNMYINDVLRAEIDPLIVKLDKELITIQATEFGKFNPDIAPATYLEVGLLYGDRSEPLYLGEKQILEQFENLNYSGRPILIGKGKLDDYALQQKIGCCNDYGVNMMQAGNFDYFTDRFAGTILGDADYFIGLIPGYVQLLTWNKYQGSYVKETPTFSHGTIVDPFTGLKFDMRVHYNDECEKYIMQFGLHYELWFLPVDAFAYGDELNGTNGTLKFKATKVTT